MTLAALMFLLGIFTGIVAGELFRFANEMWSRDE